MGTLLSMDNSALLAELNEGIETLQKRSATAKQVTVRKSVSGSAGSPKVMQTISPPAKLTIPGKKQEMPPCDKFTGKIPAGASVDPNWCNKVGGSPFIFAPATNPPPRTGAPEKNKMLPLLLIGGGLLALYLFTKK